MEADRRGWIKGLESAPKDRDILVVVPYADEDGKPGYIHALAWWVAPDPGEDNGYWDGDWAYMEIPGIGDCEPTHWKPLDLPAEYEDAEAAA
ncbi:MAG TPA: hypothetical protein VNK48_14505 [Xanthobacteraceae bacterium]|nr:hypothetical protein [Xanthobacteraceae bacterium]